MAFTFVNPKNFLLTLIMLSAEEVKVAKKAKAEEAKARKVAAVN